MSDISAKDVLSSRGAKGTPPEDKHSMVATEEREADLRDAEEAERRLANAADRVVPFVPSR